MKKLVCLLACLFISGQALAIDISPDKPRILQLSEDASSVIIGNPEHASVAIDNPRLLLITAKRPGMTGLTVLGKNGQVILQENLVVNGPTHNFIRIKNACINGGEGCQPTRMFHCEKGTACNNVIVSEPTVSGQGVGASSGGEGQSLAPDLGEGLTGLEE
jgi:hypothetical protein